MFCTSISLSDERTFFRKQYHEVQFIIRNLGTAYHRSHFFKSMYYL